MVPAAFFVIHKFNKQETVVGCESLLSTCQVDCVLYCTYAYILILSG